MSAAFIPSAQAALIPPVPSHISPITYGGHPIASTDQADTSQRATLVVVALGMSFYDLACRYSSDACHMRRSWYFHNCRAAHLRLLCLFAAPHSSVLS